MALLKNHIAMLLIMSAWLITGCQSKEEQLEQAYRKSTAWLWSQQGADGAWHSTTHDVFEDGKALTPYILYHLLLIPEDKFDRPVDGVERGVGFIQKVVRESMIRDSHALAHFDYPNYSLAYALRVLCLLEHDTTLQHLIADHLLREQFTEHRGISPDHLAYGGWGYGEPGLPYGQHGHVDISHTRRIIESLLMYDSSLAPIESLDIDERQGGKAEGPGTARIPQCSEATKRERNAATPIHENLSSLHSHPQLLTVLQSYPLTQTRIFLQGLQQDPSDARRYEGCTSRQHLPYDGGFISSTVTMYTNKSVSIIIPDAGIHYPSYATATCDGLMAMHALGMQNTKAYADARDWLQKHQDMTTIEGLSPDDPEQWHRVMHYYHFAVRAEAMTAAGIGGPWSNQLTTLLIREQRFNGNYMNPIGGANKEDDPLLATMFGVIAMTYLME
jgi:hypothetical protein